MQEEQKGELEMQLTIHTDGLEGFRRRSLERARKMDRGEKLRPEKSITFENPIEMAKVLTPERIRLYQVVKQRETSVTDLAQGLKRDRSSVSRDVRLLEMKGLVTTRQVANPGHGRVKLVAAPMEKLTLVAEL
jgi:predicted transcriptional regulator